MFYFHHYLGKISILTTIFQMGWFNHQPVIFHLAKWVDCCGLCHGSCPKSCKLAIGPWDDFCSYHSYRVVLPKWELARVECGRCISKKSMYGIFTYMYHKNQPNVGKYTLHGWYGYLNEVLIYHCFFDANLQMYIQYIPYFIPGSSRDVQFWNFGLLFFGTLERFQVCTMYQICLNWSTLVQ